MFSASAKTGSTVKVPASQASGWAGHEIGLCATCTLQGGDMFGPQLLNAQSREFDLETLFLVVQVILVAV